MAISHASLVRIANTSNSQGSIKGGVGNYEQDFPEILEKPYSISFVSGTDGNDALGLHITLTAPEEDYGVPGNVQIKPGLIVETLRVYNGTVRLYLGNGAEFTNGAGDGEITLTLEDATEIVLSRVGNKYEGTDPGAAATAFADGSDVLVTLSAIAY